MEEETYALQHFGFTALQVTLERKHLLKSLLDTALESVIKKSTSSADTSYTLKYKKEDIAQKMLNSMGGELAELETLDHKYFQIPDNVLLPEDYHHTYNYTEEQEKEADQEIAKHEQLFLENTVMIKSLEQQEEQFEKLKKFLELHLETCTKVKIALNLLHESKLNDIQNIIRATKQVSNKLENSI